MNLCTIHVAVAYYLVRRALFCLLLVFLLFYLSDKFIFVLKPYTQNYTPEPRKRSSRTRLVDYVNPLTLKVKGWKWKLKREKWSYFVVFLVILVAALVAYYLLLLFFFLCSRGTCRKKHTILHFPFGTSWKCTEKKTMYKICFGWRREGVSASQSCSLGWFNKSFFSSIFSF